MVTKEELAIIVNDVLDSNPSLSADDLAEKISQRGGLGLGYNNKFVELIKKYKRDRVGLDKLCDDIISIALSSNNNSPDYDIRISYFDNKIQVDLFGGGVCGLVARHRSQEAVRVLSQDIEKAISRAIGISPVRRYLRVVWK